MKSYIMLEKILMYAHHGVFLQETKVGNLFKIDVKLAVDLEKSSFSDELTDTVSYADVYSVIKEEMTIPSKLLEHVAGRIVRRLKKEYAEIESVELKLSKQNPPLGGQVDVASVIIID